MIRPRIPAVLVKELQILARQRTTYVLRAFYLAILVGAIALAISAAANSYRPVFEIAERTRTVFLVSLIVQGCLLGFFVPMLTATLITLEKERDTLGLLLMTNLKPRNIVLDKLLARLLHVFILLASGIPLMLALSTFGGLTWGDVLNGYAILLGIVLAMAGVCVFLSTFSDSVVAAIIKAYLILILLPFLYAGAILFFTWAIGGNGSMWNEHLVMGLILPFCPYIMVVYERNLDVMLDHSYIPLIAGAVTFVFGTVISSLALPRMTMRRRVPFMNRVHGFYDRLFAWRGRFGKRLVGENTLGRNPIIWRETTKRVTSSNAFQIRITYLTAIFWIPALGVAFFNRDEGFAETFFVITLLLFAAILLVKSATSFVSDRTSGHIDTLLTTPLTASHILVGKLLGIAKTLAAVFVLMILFLGIVLYKLITRDYYRYYDNETMSAIYGVTTFALLLLDLLVNGIWCSLRKPSALKAMFATCLWCLATFAFMIFAACLCNLDELPGVFDVLVRGIESFFRILFFEIEQPVSSSALLITLGVFVCTKIVRFFKRYPGLLYSDAR